jgi:hypothetical protein
MGNFFHYVSHGVLSELLRRYFIDTKNTLEIFINCAEVKMKMFEMLMCQVGFPSSITSIAKDLFQHVKQYKNINYKSDQFKNIAIAIKTSNDEINTIANRQDNQSERYKISKVSSAYNNLGIVKRHFDTLIQLVSF